MLFLKQPLKPIELIEPLKHHLETAVIKKPFSISSILLNDEF